MNIIFDLNSLIETYHYVSKLPDNIKSEIDNMGNIIGKFKFEKIKNNPDYKKILYLSEIRIKKVRKPLLNSDFEQIKLFNQELKTEYPNKTWINNLHTKENWINEVLKLIKTKSKSLLFLIENISGYNHYEKNRLEFDWRIVIDDNDNHTGYYHHDFKEDDPNWSDKIYCSCIKNIIGEWDDIIFKKGEKYFYRKKVDGQIIVMYKFASYIFEGDSFYEYFLSIESRDRILSQILD